MERPVWAGTGLSAAFGWAPKRAPPGRRPGRPTLAADHRHAPRALRAARAARAASAIMSAFCRCSRFSAPRPPRGPSMTSSVTGPRARQAVHEHRVVLRQRHEVRVHQPENAIGATVPRPPGPCWSRCRRDMSAPRTASCGSRTRRTRPPLASAWEKSRVGFQPSASTRSPNPKIVAASSQSAARCCHRPPTPIVSCRGRKPCARAGKIWRGSGGCEWTESALIMEPSRAWPAFGRASARTCARSGPPCPRARAPRRAGARGRLPRPRPCRGRSRRRPTRACPR